MNRVQHLVAARPATLGFFDFAPNPVDDHDARFHFARNPADAHDARFWWAVQGHNLRVKYLGHF